MPKHKAQGGFYAVHKGRTVGIFQTWAKCEAQVKGFSGAVFKRFDTLQRGCQSSVQGVQAEEAQVESTVMRRAPPPSSVHRFNPVLPRPRPVALAAAPIIVVRSSSSSSSGSDSSSSSPKRIEPKMPHNQFVLRAPSHATAPMPALKMPSADHPYEVPLEVYADGSCFGNGKAGATGGVGVWFGDEDSRNISERLAATDENPATNNRAEITAIIRALEVIDQTESPTRPVVIKSDSSYCIRAITEWLHGWERKGWVSSEQQPVKNRDLWERVLVLIRHHKRPIEWRYVAGHKGNYGNEAADALARRGQTR